MSDYRKLKVWGLAHDLALDTHRVAMHIRGRHHYSLQSQLVRAASSIPANIVEGRAKDSDKDFARFLGYAVASASELEYHIVLVRDLGLVTLNDANTLLGQVTTVSKMLNALRAKLRGPTA